MWLLKAVAAIPLVYLLTILLLVVMLLVLMWVVVLRIVVMVKAGGLRTQVDTVLTAALRLLVVGAVQELLHSTQIKLMVYNLYLNEITF